MNTLIKHCGEHHSFKIGVRELGWRKHATANPNEQLNSPADYVKIDIAERLTLPRFQELAAQICNQRLLQSNIFDNSGPNTVEELLPSLSLDEEAKLLGLDRAAIIAEISNVDPAIFDNMPDLEVFFCFQWAKWNQTNIQAVLEERLREPKKWSDRYNNYKH
jgi:hypothetical protein